MFSAKKLLPLAVVALVVGCSTASATPVATPTSAMPGTSQAAVTPAPAPCKNGVLTVWAMPGTFSESNAAALNNQFENTHPGCTVNYQVQSWGGIVAKLTTALSSNNPPDVMEIGNTQAITFEAAGALEDLTSYRAALGGGTSNVSSDPGQLWVGALNDSAMYNGKLYAVPFYAGDRLEIYRKDLFAAASIDATTITSLAKLIAAAKTLQTANASVKDFSGFYLPGEYYFALLQMIQDEGGTVATQSGGQWTATLESTASEKGIADYVSLFKAANTAGASINEATPGLASVFSAGKVGIMEGTQWDIPAAGGSITDPNSQIGVFPIPSVNDGKTAPVFLGGSDLGIAAKSPNQAAARDWVAMISANIGQVIMTGEGWIPSTKAAAAAIPNNGTLAAQTLQVQSLEAANGSFCTPNAIGWAAVEANNPITAMEGKILSGPGDAASIDTAAKAADQAIDAVINKG